MTQIGIPTLFGLIVISPLTTLMLRATPGALHIGSRFLDWYHLWFLFALLIYTPIVAMVDRADARRGWFARFDAAAQSDRAIELGVLLILPLASLIAMAILIRATAAFTADSMPALMHSSFIAGYAPLYALGFALARSARLRDALLGRRTVAPVILIAFAVVCVPLQFGDVAVGAMQSSMRVWMRLIAGAFCAPAATLVILRSAFAIDRVSPLFRRVARAGLTIYIVHFPIAVALNVAFAYVEAPVVLEYLVVVGLTTALACLIHIRIVDRWPVAALLLNGRRRRPAPRPVAVPEAAIPVPPSPSAATHG
jgi:glucan biosynthesis protein C